MEKKNREEYMRKDSKYDSRYMRKILGVIAAAAVIAFLAASFKQSEVQVYADVNTSTSLETYTWTITGTPTVYYSGTTTNSNITITDYTGNITCNGGEIQEPAVNKATTGTIKVKGTGTDYKFSISGVTLSDNSTPRFTEATNVYSGALSEESKTITFDMTDLKVESSTQKPSPTTNIIKTITNPSDLNYMTGTSKDTIMAAVDAIKQVDITTDNTAADAPKKADVTWDKAPLNSYTPSESSQSFKLQGTVTPPAGYTKPDTVANPTLTINISGYDGIIDSLPDSTLVKKVDSHDDISLKISSFNEKKALKQLLKDTSASSSECVEAIKAALNTSPVPTMTFTFSISEGDPGSSAKDRMKEAADDKKSGAKISEYFDLSLKLNINGKDYKIKDSKEEAKLKVKGRSDGSKKTGRKYAVVREHDDTSQVLNDYKSLDNDYVQEFSTHYFSDYAISYTDSSSSSSSSSSTNTTRSNSAIVPGGGGTDATGAGGGTDKSKTPKTGDDFDPKIWIYLLIVGATVASAAWILLQDTKDENKSNTGAQR